MRILQVLPTLGAGGAEGFVTNLAVSLVDCGAEVNVFLLAGVHQARGAVLLNRLLKSGITVTGIEKRSVRSPLNLLHLAYLIRAWRPDVVQANLYSAEVITAMAKLITLSKSSVFVRRLANTHIDGIDQKFSTWADKQYGLTIACSAAVLASYQEHLDGTEKRVLAIPNGGYLMPSPPSDRQRTSVRYRLGLKQSDFVIVHIGRMAGVGNDNSSLGKSQKAHDILLKSFSLAFRGDTSKKLILVGDGPLRSNLEELAGALEIADQVTFLGIQAEPWPALLSADLFCFPSRHEGLPNVLPEAGSCGLPVVASDIPEVSSLKPLDGWVLVPVDDVVGFSEAMQLVCKNIEFYRRSSMKAASLFVGKYSMERCANGYLRAYQDALDVQHCHN